MAIANANQPSPLLGQLNNTVVSSCERTHKWTLVAADDDEEDGWEWGELGV